MFFLRYATITGFCVALAAASCFAQGGYGTTVAGDIAVPVGSFSQSAKTGYGAHVDFYWESTSNLRVSLFLGYTRWGVDNDKVNQQNASMGGTGTYQLDGRVSAFPILLGVKFLAPGEGLRFYGLLEGGLYLYSAKVTGQKFENGIATQNINQESSKSVPGANLGLGLLIPLSKDLSLDLGGRYHLVKTDTYYVYDIYGNPYEVKTDKYYSIFLGVNWAYKSLTGK